jgi:hypothetical protein
MRVHQESAARHEAAAALCATRSEPEWAQLERRCAMLERAYAQLEARRMDLERSRSRFRDRPDEDHAKRQERAKRPEAAVEERRVADRAGRAEQRARSHASEWLELAIGERKPGQWRPGDPRSVQRSRGQIGR